MVLYISQNDGKIIPPETLIHNNMKLAIQLRLLNKVFHMHNITLVFHDIVQLSLYNFDIPTVHEVYTFP